MNIIAIVVAAVAAFVIGFLFHGPLFGKLWMRLADVHPTGNEKFSDMYGQMFMNLVANLVTAAVMSWFIVLAFSSPLMSFVSLNNVLHGALCGVMLGLGFVVTSSSMDVIWMKHSVKLWLFECMATLVSYAAMGAIIAGW
jgi:hypothetical protein